MPVIPEMEEYVNWDMAALPSTGEGLDFLSSSSNITTMPTVGAAGATERLQDLDLALENADGDDFSFWALEHFENNISPTLDGAIDATTCIGLKGLDRTGPFEEDLDLPDVPCTNCQLGGYQCKRIPEGQYKGYCTSCIALCSECSFAETSGSGHVVGFPSNPWPIMGDHPMGIPQEEAHVEAALGITQPASTADNSASEPARATSKTRTGVRFSREELKILKNWLSTHSRHPYPTEEEKEMLQKQTGLSKTQITNWLANTRRRNKNAVAQRSTSPGVRTWSKPIDIAGRRGAPSFELMNPLQRWQISPPENEPASVTAIQRAISTSSTLQSGLSSPYSSVHLTDDGSGRSICDSAISSANTSHSSGSFASAYSYGSRGSLGSGGSSMHRGRRRRRRKASAPAVANINNSTPLRQPLKTFQCTFCTETFRTKHDWQRHEKSLHLSLERWVCSPDGPVTFNVESGQMQCVFCGHANPDEAHIDSHNHSACQERTLAERTFYRKDHLRQHLKLVHDAAYRSQSMDGWKVTTPEIRSRCGFCGIVMDTWSFRTDHLAEHFKRGKSMADWKGDWGFEDKVLDMVENSIPPFLIHDERNSPDPFEASHPPYAARNAYELIKAELRAYIDDRPQGQESPSDGELLSVVHTLLQKTKTISRPCVGSTGSWLQDLLLAVPAGRPTRPSYKSSLQQLKITGKGDIFELDPLELELEVYVKARRLLGLTAMDRELQSEAVSIIRRVDESSSDPSLDIVQFFARLIYASTSWLTCFRARAHLPRSEDVVDVPQRSKDPKKIDSGIHNPSRLEFELAEYVCEQRSLFGEAFVPSDDDLQKRARVIIFEYDDGWNQTAADDAVWLTAFKNRHVFGNGADDSTHIPLDLSHDSMFPNPMQLQLDVADPAGRTRISAPPSISNSSSSRSGSLSGSGSNSTPSPATATGFRANLLGDVNCYQRLARELKKYVASAMSPNNPNCHVPTDEELQYQARWIIYEDDDPWNSTCAENHEWLRRFKRDAGILTDPSLPGLPLSTLSWNVAQGGSGFAPPYTIPPPAAAANSTSPESLQSNNDVMVRLREGARPFPAQTKTVDRFVKGIKARWEEPAKVFCSRELERGLAEFVEGRGHIPTDEELRQKAREVMGYEKTAADDAVLLGKFREMMVQRLNSGGGGGQQPQLAQGQPGLGMVVGGFGQVQQQSNGMSLNTMGAGTTTLTSGELDDLLLQDMDFDFTDLNGGSGFDGNLVGFEGIDLLMPPGQQTQQNLF
ncbi:pah6 homeobox protein encoded by the pah6 protein [Triangularia setosa]|uniref:Pah6 homeobox protein encoded by the pah6 protein n=1 Tax=Triangularia setosa TaxID=2587417 RepID=A0AAN6WGX1_9PEZI|nr:pah6 homeobox protein encoded by the pah6 protein [Podospora setosa]